MSGMEHRVVLTTTATMRGLGAVALLLAGADVAGGVSRFVFGHDSVFGLVPMFDFDKELNVPSYFSVLLLIMAAGLLAMIAAVERSQRARHAGKWAVLSLGFLVMGFDEGFSLHERLIEPMRKVLGNHPLGVLYFAWVIPGGALCIALGIYFLRFLLDLPNTTRRRMLISAAIYLGGAIGMELLGGLQAERHGMDNWVYATLVLFEEGLEMAGVIVFIGTLMEYCVQSRPGLGLTIGGVPARET